MICFLIGTGTEIGKTFIGTKLLSNDLKNNINSFAYKPVETGKTLFKDYVGSDSYKYSKILNCKISDVNTYFFNKPSSPHLAANLDNESIDIDFILNNIKKLNNQYENIYIEGAGGLLVPYNEDITFLDIISKFKDESRAIIITKNCLGTINHTLLTVNMLKYKDIEIEKIIFNNIDNYSDDVIKSDNIDIISKLSGINNIEVYEYEN